MDQETIAVEVPSIAVELKCKYYITAVNYSQDLRVCKTATTYYEALQQIAAVARDYPGREIEMRKVYYVDEAKQEAATPSA